jgi:hypothetical protein
VPHGVDAGVVFVENNEQGRCGNTLCQVLTVEVLSDNGIKLKQINSNGVLYNSLQSVGDFFSSLEGCGNSDTGCMALQVTYCALSSIQCSSWLVMF